MDEKTARKLLYSHAAQYTYVHGYDKDGLGAHILAHTNKQQRAIKLFKSVFAALGREIDPATIRAVRPGLIEPGETEFF